MDPPSNLRIAIIACFVSGVVALGVAAVLAAAISGAPRQTTTRHGGAVAPMPRIVPRLIAIAGGMDLAAGIGLFAYSRLRRR
ncbi:MAG: hypothetical protein IT208_00370 [Chthonomonadales bacterium]|nr:hypothetical protein [Chthonomonadales bacterium]